MQTGDLIQYKEAILEIKEVKKVGHKCSHCYACNNRLRCKHLPLCWTKEKEFFFVKLSLFKIRRAKKAGKKITNYKEHI
ncbi:hypothetical protein [Butyricimonas sp.]|uniref:hypothetical protein n=1 Tax=Butyricimonas sp. TaxID=1969738 RepID=UPI0025BD3ACF|nr:hypothetical protein [Butyricimonas sp.]